MRVLVLGGTADGRALVRALADASHEAIVSVAGRTESARKPGAGIVTGGFGGADGLAAWLVGEGVRAVVDATHPFAARMSFNAARACAVTGTPLLRLDRPGWASHPRASTWTWAEDHAAAALAAARLAGAEGRVFLSVGRQPLPHYRALPRVFARVAELPRDAEGRTPPVPAGWTIREDRGPYDVAGERALLAGEGIAVLVTKDSGGAATSAKLDAAAGAGIPVVVVRRPAAPEGVPAVHAVADAVAWVDALAGGIPSGDRSR